MPKISFTTFLIVESLRPGEYHTGEHLFQSLPPLIDAHERPLHVRYVSVTNFGELDALMINAILIFDSYYNRQRLLLVLGYQLFNASIWLRSACATWFLELSGCVYAEAQCSRQASIILKRYNLSGRSL